VLAVDTQDQRNSEQKTILGQNVTVAATPNEATRLSLASSIGELRLMLKNAGDTTRINQVVAKASDLDKPVSSGDGSPADAGGGAGGAGAPPLPVLPDDKGAGKRDDAPAAEKPRRRHVMTIVNGTQVTKAIYVEGEEEEDVAGGPTEPPPAKEEKKEEKPEAKKDAPKPPPAPPAGPAPAPASPFGKSMRTRGSR